MRIIPASVAGIAVVAALLTSACGPKALALPDDATDKAATCGVVEAAHARKALKAANAVLPFADQGRVLHYAMLTAASDDGFDTEKASAVTKRMPELEPKITKGKFEPLLPACAEAFPATKIEASLPGDAFDSALGCYELSGFLARALRAGSVDYGDQLSAYGDMRQRLDAKVGSGLARRGAAGEDAQKAKKSKALATMTRLGSPMAVMDKCLAAYPEAKPKG